MTSPSPFRRHTPRIVHRIWLGDKPAPVEHEKAFKSLTILGYQVRDWFERDHIAILRKTVAPDILRIIDADANPGHQSDIYRILVAYAFGGLVCDYDVEFVDDPAPVFAAEGAFVSSYTFPGQFEPAPQNCFLGGPDHHPFWAHCLAYLPGDFEAHATRPVWYRTGPCFIGRMARLWNARLRHSDEALRLLPAWMVWQRQCGQPRPAAPLAIHHGVGSWYDETHTFDASPAPDFGGITEPNPQTPENAASKGF